MNKKDNFKDILLRVGQTALPQHERQLLELEIEELTEKLFNNKDVIGEETQQPGNRAVPSVAEVLMYIKLAQALYNFIKGIVYDVRGGNTGQIEGKKTAWIDEMLRLGIPDENIQRIISNHFEGIIDKFLTTQHD